ncbi:MAG: hypothetical protein R3B09_27775 [Nannocystaceae bacterium]
MRFVLELPIAPADAPDLAPVDDLPFTVVDAVTGWLGDHLDALDNKVLDAIDGASMIEVDEDAIAEGRLELRVADHWYPGAIAAMHWLEVALTRAPEVLEAALATHGYAPAGAFEPGTWPPLVPVGDDLVVVGTDGEVSSTEGIPFAPTPAEAATIAEAARDRRCRCSLCRARPAS